MICKGSSVKLFFRQVLRFLIKLAWPWEIPSICIAILSTTKEQNMKIFVFGQKKCLHNNINGQPKWSNTLKQFVDCCHELFECVGPFYGIGA